MDALAPVYAALGAVIVPTLVVMIAAGQLRLVRAIAEPARSRFVRLVRILGGIVLLFCVGAGVAATVLALTQPRADAPVEQHRVRFRTHAAAITAPESARSGA